MVKKNVNEIISFLENLNNNFIFFIQKYMSGILEMKDIQAKVMEEEFFSQYGGF